MQTFACIKLLLLYISVFEFSQRMTVLHQKIHFRGHFRQARAAVIMIAQGRAIPHSSQNNLKFLKSDCPMSETKTIKSLVFSTLICICSKQPGFRSVGAIENRKRANCHQ